MDYQETTNPQLKSVFSYRNIIPESTTTARPGPDRSRRPRASFATRSRVGDVYNTTDFARYIGRAISTPESPNQSDYHLDSYPQSQLSLHDTDHGEPPFNEPITALPQEIPWKPVTNQPCSPSIVWKEIWLPLLWIIGSMLAVLITLIVVLSVYMVIPVKGLFFEPTGWNYTREKVYLLLTIPATWLTFITARGGQFAALLSGPLMQLWTWRTVQSLVDAPKFDGHRLPSTYQFSILIGMCMASYDRLRRWVSYCWFRQQRRKAPPSPPVLVEAALMLLWCGLLAFLMLAADAVVHYTTETVEYHQVLESKAINAYGRGLSQACLSWNRIRNHNVAYPCTLNDNIYNGNEQVLLSQNNSLSSEMRVWTTDQDTDIAFMLPKTDNLSPYIDYRASSIGITTKCTPITQACNFEGTGQDDYYSKFSCSPEFYGILGQVANETATPELAFQMDSNLIFAFFTDETLAEPYNSDGSGSSGANGTIPPLTDAQLINEVYIAMAVRFSTPDSATDEIWAKDPGVFQNGSIAWDMVMSCSYKALDVNYTWFNGTVRELEASPAPNGTISELWHGSQLPASSTIVGNDVGLQTILQEAAMQNSSTSFAQAWSRLYSLYVMSTIGGVTSSRSNLLQQMRKPILVVKVWIPSLAFFMLCCVLYMVTSCVLAIWALQTSSRGDMRDARSRLTLFGIVNWAVSSTFSEGRQDPGEKLPREESIGKESETVGLVEGSGDNFHLQVFKDLEDEHGPLYGFI